MHIALIVAALVSANAAITQNAVGPVQLGQPIPKASFAGATYKTSFYADAQPLEGFALKDPAILAIVDGGPFMKWGMDHPGLEPSEKLKKDAMKKGPKLKTSMIIVTSPDVLTDKGAHVGSTFAEVKAAHPDIKTMQLPGMWEEPSCIAQDKTIHFFFKKCPMQGPMPDDEKVIRIVVKAVQ